MDTAEEDLYIGKSFLSPDDLVRSGLIIEELSDAMSFNYGKVIDSDTLAWGNLLLRTRRLGERQDKFSLDRVFTTGLPQEEEVRYYSS